MRANVAAITCATVRASYPLCHRHRVSWSMECPLNVEPMHLPLENRHSWSRNDISPRLGKLHRHQSIRRIKTWPWPKEILPLDRMTVRSRRSHSIWLIWFRMLWPSLRNRHRRVTMLRDRWSAWPLIIIVAFRWRFGAALFHHGEIISMSLGAKTTYATIDNPMLCMLKCTIDALLYINLDDTIRECPRSRRNYAIGVPPFGMSIYAKRDKSFGRWVLPACCQILINTESPTTRWACFTRSNALNHVRTVVTNWSARCSRRTCSSITKTGRFSSPARWRPFRHLRLWAIGSRSYDISFVRARRSQQLCAIWLRVAYWWSSSLRAV